MLFITPKLAVWDSACSTMSVWTVCVALVFAVSAGSLVACCSENYHGKFHWTWVLSSVCVSVCVMIEWLLFEFVRETEVVPLDGQNPCKYLVLKILFQLIYS